MTKTRIIWFVLPAVLGLGLFTYAKADAHPRWAGGHGHHGASSVSEVEERMDHKIERLLDAVDATPAQRASAAQLVKKLAPNAFALMNEGRALRTELKDALLAEKQDPARLATLRTKADLLAEKLVDQGMDGITEVSSLLTPAQRKRVADKLADMHL